MEDMLNTFLIKHKHPVRDVGADFSLLPYNTKRSISLLLQNCVLLFFDTIKTTILTD